MVARVALGFVISSRFSSELVHLLLVALPIGFAQFRLQDFAGAGQGQGIGFEADAAGAFVVGDPFVAVGDDGGLVGILAFRQADDGVDLIAPILVRNADHGAFDDGVMLIDGVLHLGRIDVLAARDDHILDPIHDIDKAVFVHTAAIAGV